MINVKEQYKYAQDVYNQLGVDVAQALQQLSQLQISLHCWQADDVAGFENTGTGLSGGIQVTGNYPGKANNIVQLRHDITKVVSLLPGTFNLNLHAIYGDFSHGTEDRNQLSTKSFESWVSWAKQQNMGLDFNATCFSHAKATDGFTLSHPDAEIRQFWVDHVKQCRSIASYFGQQLNTQSVHNLWIPDGAKDTTVNKLGYRERLLQSLDSIFTENLPHLSDAVESKLFGIGSEAMVVGSYDFYLAWALQNKKILCLDNGHFHPTEDVADKISSLLPFFPKLLLHLTRGLRWDSDHVPLLTDPVADIAQEVVRANALNRVFVALDFFDASINRIGAYVVGTRAVQKAFLLALLSPNSQLNAYEEKGKHFERMHLLELAKQLPWGAVWNYYCHTQNTPLDFDIINEVEQYEKHELANR